MQYLFSIVLTEIFFRKPYLLTFYSIFLFSGFLPRIVGNVNGKANQWKNDKKVREEIMLFYRCFFI